MSHVEPRGAADDSRDSQPDGLGTEQSDSAFSSLGIVSSGVPVAGERPRLAAIVFTDVVGYSSRMHADEKGTIAAVHADFETMREKCMKYGGEVLNTMGDGMMLAFDGAVPAMQFALEMQNEFGERNAKLPTGKGLQHRVGVHIGDVYRVQGGHMAGDGVNIAARLEPRAAHGGIAISQMVYDTVRSKVTMKAERMGAQTFKNIAEPIVVWRVSPPGAAKPPPPPRPVYVEEPTFWPRMRKFIWIVVWLAVLLLVEDIFRDYKDVQALGSAFPQAMQNLKSSGDAVMRLFGK